MAVVPSLAETYSHVRIVRLSFVEGTVSVERPGASGWEAAPVNTPIEEGFKVATGADSFAEVEFENTSTARIGEQSELDFTQLALDSSGAKINRMAMVQGYATFNVMPESSDVYEVTAGGATLDVSGRTMFRVDLSQSAERVEVFRGIVNVSSPNGSGQLTQSDVLNLALTPAAQDAYVVTHGITEDAWDKWVQQRDQVLLSENSRGVPPAVSSYSDYSSMYGWNDLSYYGAWNDIPGYGYGWSPFMSAGWMPYSFGQWGYYPGFGWTWISYEPWGWMPFHYGNWMFISGYGWNWFPGNFGYWSPALVTWYQGNGWIGWSPGTTTANGTQAGCPAGQNCTVAVNMNTFTRGRPVNPNDILRVRTATGVRVATPSMAPAESVLQPGPAPRPTSTSAARTFTGTSSAASARVASGMHTIIVGTRSGARAPTVVLPQVSGFASTTATSKTPSSIVFNPQTRRFENNPDAEQVQISRGGGGSASKQAGSRSVASRTLAPAAEKTTLNTQSSVAAPSPKMHDWLYRMFVGNGSTQTQNRSGSFGRGNAPSPGGRMTLGNGSSAPRGRPSFSHSAPRPSFSHASSPPSGGGGRMSMGGGGHMSMGSRGGGGGGHSSSAPVGPRH